MGLHLPKSAKKESLAEIGHIRLAEEWLLRQKQPRLAVENDVE